MSPWNWKLTLFILGIVFKGFLLNGGCEEKKHNARFFSAVTDWSRPESILKDGSPLGTGYFWEDKVSLYHGGLSRTISMVPLPPLQCHDTRLVLAVTKGSLIKYKNWTKFRISQKKKVLYACKTLRSC